MKTLRVASLALAGFLAVAGAWYVNGWDYESAYSRGVLDGARVGFLKGRENAIEDIMAEQVEATVAAAGPV